MGADVVKVESVGLGDDTRYMPPLRTAGHTSAGAVFLSVNRNKRRSGILAAYGFSTDEIKALAAAGTIQTHP